MRGRKCKDSASILTRYRTGDRDKWIVFLDANVLFSAAYRENVGLLQFWKLKNVALCSSHYALEEARINLEQDIQKSRLQKLARAIDAGW